MPEPKHDSSISDLRNTMKWQTGIIVSVILAIVGLAGRWADSVDTNISKMQDNIQSIQVEMAQYRQQVSPVSQLESRIRELERLIDRMGKQIDVE